MRDDPPSAYLSHVDTVAVKHASPKHSLAYRTYIRHRFLGLLRHKIAKDKKYRNSGKCRWTYRLEPLGGLKLITAISRLTSGS